MRIFITGGSGFIGRYLLKELNIPQNELLVLTRNPKNLKQYKNIKIISGDLSRINRSSEKIKVFNPDATIHLAWEGIPDLGIENSVKNLTQGLSLIELLAETNCKKIIITGSVWEYGNQKGRISEDVQTKPFNSFTLSKNTLHLLGRELAEKNGISFIWTRVFYVYGPGQKESSLIPHLINTIKNKETPEIRNPLAKNDFIFVEDVARALKIILDKEKNSGMYNIGSGKFTSVKSIIKSIFNKFDIKEKYQNTDKKLIDSVNYLCADISRLKTLGWTPEITVKEGIEKMIEANNHK